MPALRSLAAVFALCLSAACVSAGGGYPYAVQGFAPGDAGGAGVEPAAGPARAAPATVRVTNHNWSNMTVYLVRGTARFRLGMVTSMSSELFRVPAGAMGGADGLRLLADPIGSTQGYLTQPLHVNAGERVQFDIHNQLSVSSVTVRSR